MDSCLRVHFRIVQCCKPSTRNKEGKMVVVTDKVEEFASFVSRLKKDSADERIQFETIKIDGPLAIVWTPYNFYLQWKIQSLRSQFISVGTF